MYGSPLPWGSVPFLGGSVIYSIQNTVHIHPSLERKFEVGENVVPYEQALHAVLILCGALCPFSS